MDDVPAGPASPEPRRPSLSVVVPVRNGGRDFERCLLRLRDSFLTDFELIVIDDGSTDDSAALAARAGATVYRHPTPLGPAAARNLGRSRRDRRRLIFFLDADVAVHPPDVGTGTRPVRARPGPVGPLRLLRRQPGRAGHRQPVSQPAPSFRPPAGAVRAGNPAGPHVLDRLRTHPPRRLPRLRRLRPGALSAAGDRRHRAGLPPDPGRAPDRAGTRRPRHAHEALDPGRDGAHRHLQPRRALDDPAQADRHDRDRPERQGRPESVRGLDRRHDAGRARLLS